MILKKIDRTKAGKTVAVFADESCVPTSAGALAAMFLFEGKDLDEEQITAFRELSERFLCRDYALDAVSRRRMSEKELREKLSRKGWEATAADYAVEWLRERGYIDDEYYAGALARHYGGKGYGAGRVRAELSRRGVSREYWDDAMEELPDSAEALDRFIAAKLKNPEDRDEVRKVTAALCRRGYGWEEIRSALRRRGTDEPEEY